MKKVFLMILMLSVFFTPLFAMKNPEGLIDRLPTKKKVVSLTFDDGPLPVVTDTLLAILEQEKIRATFFLIGINMAKHPKLVEKIYMGGHDLGNHSYHHIRLDQLMGEALQFEIADTNHLFTNILGFTQLYFRPPGGRTNAYVLDRADEHSLIPVGWTLNANDFLYRKEQLSEEELESRTNRIIRNFKQVLKPGSIILMHNGNDISIRLLPKLIKFIKDEGYSFVPLSTFLK